MRHLSQFQHLTNPLRIAKLKGFAIDDAICRIPCSEPQPALQAQEAILDQQCSDRLPGTLQSILDRIASTLEEQLIENLTTACLCTADRSRGFRSHKHQASRHSQVKLSPQTLRYPIKMYPQKAIGAMGSMTHRGREQGQETQEHRIFLNVMPVRVQLVSHARP